jgi:hypothetical protein
VTPFNYNRRAEEIRQTWQARALSHTAGKLAAVVMIILFHNYAEAMPVLLRVVYPGFTDITKPFFCSGATILKNGKIVCALVNRAGERVIKVVYGDEYELQADFRNLAELLKLSDAERVEMTEAVRNWVVADHRINHLGEKVKAS